MALNTKKILGIALLVGGAIYYFNRKGSVEKTAVVKPAHPIAPGTMPPPPGSTYPEPIAGAPAYINVSDGTRIVKLPIKSKVTYKGEKVVIWQILDVNTVKVKLEANRLIMEAKASDLKL